VLLVDANDANPTLHKTFGIEMRQGLQNALADQFSPLECVTSTQIEHLSLVVNGKLDSNETAIYSKSSIDETLSDWRDAFRIVVVDLPPANLVANGAFLAKHLDSVLLVVEAGRAQRHVVSKTSAHLQKIGVPLKGAIYNKVAKASGGIPQ
jgi:capsular exopolysaccharide synthesis family protein